MSSAIEVNSSGSLTALVTNRGLVNDARRRLFSFVSNGVEPSTPWRTWIGLPGFQEQGNHLSGSVRHHVGLAGGGSGLKPRWSRHQRRCRLGPLGQRPEGREPAESKYARCSHGRDQQFPRGEPCRSEDFVGYMPIRACIGCFL